MIKNGKPAHDVRYGMLIDLDRCSGCGACMVACAVENNVPPPHKDSTPRTGLNWLRVFRVQAGDRTAFVPVPCMQCDHEAPCVNVCPQNAVELDPVTGVVGQIPERCLGCRYCMAACPYQARVFNWRDPHWPAGLETMLNPNVSVRQRGTVEKCNFCHGRWHAAREAGSNEYTPACVEACPSQAIQFVDRKKTPVESGAFTLLAELGTEPKVHYKTSRPALAAALTNGKGLNRRG